MHRPDVGDKDLKRTEEREPGQNNPSLDEKGYASDLTFPCLLNTSACSFDMTGHPMVCKNKQRNEIRRCGDTVEKEECRTDSVGEAGRLSRSSPSEPKRHGSMHEVEGLDLLLVSVEVGKDELESGSCSEGRTKANAGSARELAQARGRRGERDDKGDRRGTSEVARCGWVE